MNSIGLYAWLLYISAVFHVTVCGFIGPTVLLCQVAVCDFTGFKLQFNFTLLHSCRRFTCLFGWLWFHTDIIIKSNFLFMFFMFYIMCFYHYVFMGFCEDVFLNVHTIHQPARLQIENMVNVQLCYFFYTYKNFNH